MTFYVEQEVRLFGDFDLDEITKTVIEKVMDFEACPYEVQVEIILTDDAQIHKVNLEKRGIDRPTDVLSFPAISFEKAADFKKIANGVLTFDPHYGELLLGDIMISVQRLREQAATYGHSLKREYAFLLTHSLLHLLGYDHMEANEAKIMEQKQKTILEEIGIFR